MGEDQGFWVGMGQKKIYIENKELRKESAQGFW